MPSKFNQELIDKALALSDEIGNKKAAEQLGLKYSTIDYWRGLRKRAMDKEVKKSKTKTENSKSKTEKSEKTSENKQPEKENKPEKEIKDVKRGQIYYIVPNKPVGHEMSKGRPAIVVSNDEINAKNGTIEVVYLTTNVSVILPTRINITATGIKSAVVCEQVSTVDKSRISRYIGDCTPDEMKFVEEAILISLGIKCVKNNTIEDCIIKTERDIYKDVCNRLLDSMTNK